MTNHPNRAKERDGPLLKWRAMDPVSGRRLRDRDGLVPFVSAYTAQSARHAVKRILTTYVSFYVEQVEEGG